MEGKISRSLDHSNWWEPDHWKMRSGQISTSLGEADPAEIRNGWLTLPDPKARFQQKQLQEREQKIASLYESQQARALDRVRHSPSNGLTSTTPTLPSPQTLPHQPGKVRQMFEERRTKAGIDKSYPLQPIQNTERTQPRKTMTNGLNKLTTKTADRKALKTLTTNTHTVKKQTTTKVHKVGAAVNGSGDVNHNHELDLNTNTSVQPRSNGEVQKDERDANDNTELIENETFPELALEQLTPRTTPDTNGNNNNKKSSPAATRPRSPVKTKPAAVTTPRKLTSDNKAARENSKPRGAMQRTVNSSPQTSASKARSTTERSSEGACGVCGRHFAPDRLARHQDICRKTHAKKRKPFDVLKHRLAGTEAEPFINRLRKGPANTSSTKLQKPLNSTWRQKHEEFIQAIRAAKQVQAHLNAGGKLSDLPPPPPSENPDYVQCPHCKRRFNQAAADRHIPKCANFQFNKSKQPPKKR